MTWEEARQEIFRLRGKFASPYNQSDKVVIERLYLLVLGKRFRPTSCQNCYHDAVIELYLYANKNTKMTERKYLLKAGAIINTPIFDNGKVYSNANLTDDVAERFLSMFPEKVVLFQKVPEKTAETDVESSPAVSVDEVPTEQEKRPQKGRKMAKSRK